MNPEKWLNPTGFRKMVTQKEYGRLQKDHNCLEKKYNAQKVRLQKKDAQLKRARSRGDYYEKKSKEKDKKIETLTSENKTLKNENKALKEEQQKNVGLKEIPREQLIYFCVCLVIHCGISFRSIPKIITAMCTCLNLITIIPDRTTIMNWVKQVSFYKLENVKEMIEPFLIIVDITMKKGCSKLMTILRVPLNIYEQRIGGISKSEVEIVGMFVSEKLDKYIVCEKLFEVFKKIGVPLQLILDGGGDLNAGVNLLKQKYSEFRKIHVVRDITHLFANLLKNKYKENNIFKFFTKQIKRTGSLLRQTKLSGLMPPKLRSIGRFQSIIKSVEWGLNAINFYKIRKRGKSTKYQNLLSRSLSWLTEMHEFLSIFREECLLLNDIQKLLKLNGMNQEMYKKCIDKINGSKISQDFKEKIILILKKYIRNASLLSKKINVSSDVIESLFGVYKQILERSKTADIASTAMYLPSLVGKITQEFVSEAIKKYSIKDVKDWQRKNIPKSEYSKKTKLPKIFRTTSKPNSINLSPIPKSADLSRVVNFAPLVPPKGLSVFSIMPLSILGLRQICQPLLRLLRVQFLLKVLILVD